MLPLKNNLGAVPEQQLQHWPRNGQQTGPTKTTSQTAGKGRHGDGLRRDCVERPGPCLLYTSDAADEE